MFDFGFKTQRLFFCFYCHVFSFRLERMEEWMSTELGTGDLFFKSPFDNA